MVQSDDDFNFVVDEDPEIEELGELFEVHSPLLSEQLNHSAHIAMHFTSPPTFVVEFLKGVDEKKVDWPRPWVEAKEKGRIHLTVTYNHEYGRTRKRYHPIRVNREFYFVQDEFSS